MTMAPHSTSVSKLEDPEDLLLSYLNADCLDTTNTTTSTTLDMINTKPSLSPSSASFDDPFSPQSNYASPWSSMPFIFNVNALASACLESPDLTAGISPCSISRFGSPSSSSPDMPNSLNCVPLSYALTTYSPDVKHNQPPTTTVSSSSSSPAISTVSSVTSSDADEPKRKRERKKQQQKQQQELNKSPPRHGTPTAQQPPIMMHTCKPILPAANNGHPHPHHHQHLTPPPPASAVIHVKPEPMDLDASVVLTTLDNNSNTSSSRCDTATKLEGDRMVPSKKQQNNNKTNDTQPSRQQQQQQKPTAIDAHNKRQERLIKNRAAALLSRKRKREHLQALEHERQWLTKDNGLLKAKTAALEAKVHALEKESQEQHQRYLLLQVQLQQQQRHLFHQNDDLLEPSGCNHKKNKDNDGNKTTSALPMLCSLDPISKVTNVLMILLISFALLSLPVSSDRRQLSINEDKDTPPFASSNTGAEKNMSSLYLPLVLHQQQEQQQHLHHHISTHSVEKIMDMDSKSDLYYQHTPSVHLHHHIKNDPEVAASSIDHIHIPPSTTLAGKRKRDATLE